MENSKLSKYGADYGVDMKELEGYLNTIGLPSLIGLFKYVDKESMTKEQKLKQLTEKI